MSTEDFVDKIPTRSINIFTSVIIILFTIVIGGFLLIDRPDIVLGNVKLIANNQPFELLAPHTGKLILLKYPNDSVSTSQDIAYISNPTDYNVVNELTSLLNRRDYSHIYNILKDEQKAKKIGSLNSSCMNLRSIIYKYITYNKKSLFEESKYQLESEIATLGQQIELKDRLLNVGYTNTKMLQSTFKEDSMLYIKGVITKTDYDRSYKTLLSQKEHCIEAENALLAYKMEKTTKLLKLNELSIDNTNNHEALSQEVEQAINSLQNDLQMWSRQYVISSPINGKMELVTSVEEKQFVKQDTPIIRILPNNGEIVGQIMFTSKESNGIREKSLVKVYLDNYPNAQNGYFLGHISDISSSVYTAQTGESFYWAKVRIDFSKQPYFQGNFQFVHGMTGRAEIIIKEKNLMTQILYILSSNI